MSEFVTPGGLQGFDYVTSGTQPSEKGVAPAHRNTVRLFNKTGDPANIGRGEIEIHDFSLQGFNHPEGDFAQNANGFAWSELVTHRPNELLPPPDTQGAQGFGITGDVVGIHACNALGTKFIGVGSGTNLCLLFETSQSDLDLTISGYDAGSAICSLTRVVDDGVERLAVGRIGAAVQLLSDAGGTVDITMHISTNSCWGIIMSGVNGTDGGVPVMLMYCGTTIGTKATNADLTTAIVATVPATTVNAGGVS